MTVISHRCLGTQTCQLRRRLPFSFPQEHTLQLQQNRSRPASDGSRDSDERAPAELGDSRSHWGEPDVPGARDSRLLHAVRGRAKSRGTGQARRRPEQEGQGSLHGEGPPPSLQQRTSWTCLEPGSGPRPIIPLSFHKSLPAHLQGTRGCSGNQTRWETQSRHSEGSAFGRLAAPL